MVFLEVQEINLQDNMRDGKCDEKVPFPFDPVSFFSKYFYLNSQ